MPMSWQCRRRLLSGPMTTRPRLMLDRPWSGYGRDARPYIPKARRTEAMHLGPPGTPACLLRSIDDRDFAVARLVVPCKFALGDDSIDRLRSKMGAGTRPRHETQREV